MLTVSPVAAPTPVLEAQARPLFVDLDGSLVATDLLWESFVQVGRRHPLTALSLALRMLTRGKAWFKHEVAQAADVAAETLPYRENVVTFLRTEHSAGRRLILATAADRSLAERVAAHLNLFAAVLASDGTTNLSGARKATAIETWCQGEKYDYLGDSATDLPVWEKAESALVVGGSARLLREVRQVTRVEHQFTSAVSPLVWLKAARVHHWSKNLLILVPLITSHNLGHLPLLWLALICFVAFGLCCSGTYILNDLMDLEADRRHATKKFRPLAAGLISVPRGLAVAVALIGAAFVLAHALPGRGATLCLSLYLTITLAYSMVLKRVVIIDVLVLAGLYTLRIVAGAAAVAVHLSFWLLAFSMFFFLSLAFVKRYKELLGLSATVGTSHGRDYQADDADMIRAMGPASGYMAVMVLAFYINSPDVLPLYRQPEYLWMICPLLLYWISRVWMLTHRGHMNDDPVAFALKDRQSYWLALLTFSFIALAAIGPRF